MAKPKGGKVVQEWWKIKTMRDKAEPLRKLSGAKTAKMGAELSDAALKLLVTSLRREGKFDELDRILWGDQK
ncbi:MAG: hypothetical protein QMD95_02355 [Candidatus Hodarchaeaceae archaeon]|nr:hypothetical protein [Candidatus Hodarchaeaceae archaeon]